MKQGKLINRIMMLVLLAAVVVYLAASAWRSFPGSVHLCDLLRLHRGRQPGGHRLPGAGGDRPLRRRHGGAAARGGGEGGPGETVALLYQSGEGLERRQELESLTLEREQLEMP